MILTADSAEGKSKSEYESLCLRPELAKRNWNYW